MSVKILLNSLKAVAITVALTVIILLAFNYIAFRCSDPEPVIAALAWFIAPLAGVGGGIAAVRFEKEKGMMCALVCAAIYSAVYSLVSVAAGGDELTVFLRVLTVFAAVMLFAFLCFPRKSREGKKLKEFRRYSKKH